MDGQAGCRRQQRQDGGAGRNRGEGMDRQQAGGSSGGMGSGTGGSGGGRANLKGCVGSSEQPEPLRDRHRALVGRGLKGSERSRKGSGKAVRGSRARQCLNHSEQRRHRADLRHRDHHPPAAPVRALRPQPVAERPPERLQTPSPRATPASACASSGVIAVRRRPRPSRHRFGWGTSLMPECGAAPGGDGERTCESCATAPNVAAVPSIAPFCAVMAASQAAGPGQTMCATEAGSRMEVARPQVTLLGTAESCCSTSQYVGSCPPGLAAQGATPPCGGRERCAGSSSRASRAISGMVGGSGPGRQLVAGGTSSWPRDCAGSSRAGLAGPAWQAAPRRLPAWPPRPVARALGSLPPSPQSRRH